MASQLDTTQEVQPLTAFHEHSAELIRQLKTTTAPSPSPWMDNPNVVVLALHLSAHTALTPAPASQNQMYKAAPQSQAPDPEYPTPPSP